VNAERSTVSPRKPSGQAAQRQSVCALVSGGLDSCVMLAELAKRHAEVYPVFIRHGLAWEEAELHAVRQFLRALRRFSSSLRKPSGQVPHPSSLASLTILELPVRDIYGAHWSTTGRRVPGKASPDVAVYLPGRNLLLLSKAAVFCARHNIGTIAIGSLRGNPFPDGTAKFFCELAAVAGAALGCRLKIIAPLRGLTKEQVVRRGQDLPLHLSFSCIAPKRGVHCGRCNKCAERRRALLKAGVDDKTQYADAR
jgi:7-cyano-7-deazaguanine synthase